MATTSMTKTPLLTLGGGGCEGETMLNEDSHSQERGRSKKSRSKDAKLRPRSKSKDKKTSRARSKSGDRRLRDARKKDSSTAIKEKKTNTSPSLQKKSPTTKERKTSSIPSSRSKTPKDSSMAMKEKKTSEPPSLQKKSPNLKERKTSSSPLSRSKTLQQPVCYRVPRRKNGRSMALGANKMNTQRQNSKDQLMPLSCMDLCTKKPASNRSLISALSDGSTCWSQSGYSSHVRLEDRWASDDNLTPSIPMRSGLERPTKSKSLDEIPTLPARRDGSEIPMRSNSLDGIPPKPARGNGSVNHETTFNRVDGRNMKPPTLPKKKLDPLPEDVSSNYGAVQIVRIKPMWWLRNKSPRKFRNKSSEEERKNIHALSA